MEDWPGEITIINGKPRHPQSQGLIEKGNSTVEEMLACKFYNEKQANWTFWLLEIQCESYNIIIMCNCLDVYSYGVVHIATCIYIYVYIYVCIYVTGFAKRGLIHAITNI